MFWEKAFAPTGRRSACNTKTQGGALGCLLLPPWGLRWVTPLAGDYAGRLTKQGFLLFLPALVLRLHNLVGIAGEVLQQLIGGGRGIHANPMLWR